MCNFNNLNEETKQLLHLFMQKASQNIGGVNFLLSLIETIREKHYLLTDTSRQVNTSNTTLSWNKVIFKDKILLIEEILLSHKESQEQEFNILAQTSKKRKKRVENLIKALKPVEFVAKPKNPENGGGFSFGVFDTIDFENRVAKFNPIFIAIFFCSVDFTKKALHY